MAVCLECGNRHARVQTSRVIATEQRLVQSRILLCPQCGLLGQLIVSTGRTLKKDLPHGGGGKDPTGTPVDYR